MNAWQLFTGLNKGESRVLQGKRKIFGLKFNVAGMRCRDGDFLIIAITESADDALKIYGYRWEIETLFGCLKTRGFNLEDTHITRLYRLGKLMAVLAFEFCWARKVGEWKNEVTPIKIKKHGRHAMSLFRCGVNILRRILCGKTPSKAEVRQVLRVLFSPPDGVQIARVGVTL